MLHVMLPYIYWKEWIKMSKFNNLICINPLLGHKNVRYHNDYSVGMTRSYSSAAPASASPSLTTRSRVSSLCSTLMLPSRLATCLDIRQISASSLSLKHLWNHTKQILLRHGKHFGCCRNRKSLEKSAPDLGVLQLLRDLSHGEVVQHGRGGRVVPRYPRTRRVQPRGVERLVIRVLDVG